MAAAGQAADAAAPRAPISRRLHKFRTNPGVAEFHPTACEGPPRRPQRSQNKQSGAIGTAFGTRLDRDSLLKQATAGRMWIQFAADAEWPHTDPSNHPIRREFQLPATRPFIG